MVALRGRQPELLEDARDVLLDRADGEHELLGDAGVRAALGHQPEHLELARRQPLERAACASPREELRDDLGIERRAAVRDAPDGVDEVGDVHHAVLQQVADAAVAVGEQLGRVGLLDVLRDDEDRRLGDAAPGLDGGPDALVAERRRQPDVDDRDVRLLRRDHAEERVAVLDRGDHVEAVVAEQPRRARRGAARGPRRSRRAWQLRPHGRRASRRARDAERPVERLDAPPEPGQARCRPGRRRRCRRLAPRRRAFRRRRCTAIVDAARRPRACRVRERLGDDEVGGGLDRRPRPLGEVDGDVDAHRACARRAPRSRPRDRGR